jgi:hypothetical protein
MEEPLIISNTTPLINFAEIERLDVLEAMYGRGQEARAHPPPYNFDAARLTPATIVGPDVPAQSKSCRRQAPILPRLAREVQVSRTWTQFCQLQPDSTSLDFVFSNAQPPEGKNGRSLRRKPFP